MLEKNAIASAGKFLLKLMCLVLLSKPSTRQTFHAFLSVFVIEKILISNSKDAQESKKNIKNWIIKEIGIISI